MVADLPDMSLLMVSSGFAWPSTLQSLGTVDPVSVELAFAALKHVPLVLLVVLQFCSVGVAGAEASGPSPGTQTAGNASADAASSDGEEQCSKSMGFNESSGPRDRSFQDLIACDEHHGRTCCERNHTAKARSWIMAAAGDRSQRCARMGQLALCSLCDGDVGVGAKSAGNLVLLCPSFCLRWFQACAEDFFSPSGGAGLLQPCGPGSLVCSPLKEITESSEDFCRRVSAGALGVGFTVAKPEEEPDACFDGVPAARSRGAAKKAFYTRPVRSLSWSQWWNQHLHRLLPPQVVSKFLDLERRLQEYVPGILVAVVVVLFGLVLWSNGRD